MEKEYLSKHEKAEVVKTLEIFADEAKFQASTGPGMLRKEDWTKLRKLYLKFKGG